MPNPDHSDPAAERRRIAAADYERHLAALKHLFLVGDLRKPVSHPFIHDERVEIVLCAYEAGDDGAFHWHKDVTEYELILEGRICYLDAATGQRNSYGPGDLSIVPATWCVKREVPEPARTLAVKVPARPFDKVHCADCPRPDCLSRQSPRLPLLKEEVVR